MGLPSREEAWLLLNEYTDNPNLVKHAIAVEAAMRAYAEKFGEDLEKWGLVGLLHDFDYDRFPEEHPFKGAEILESKDYPEDVVYAMNWLRSISSFSVFSVYKRSTVEFSRIKMY